jgi:hypothetical protein
MQPANAKHNREPDRPVEIHGGNRDHHPGEADHGADREVELSGNHQQAGADGEDAQVSGHLRPVHDAVEIEHARAACGDPEHDEDQYGAGDRGEFRTIKDVPETGFAADTLVGGGRCGDGG